MKPNIKRRRKRYHETRGKNPTDENRIDGYLKYAEVKTNQLTKGVEEAVSSLDPFAEEEDIERSKAALSRLQKNLDFEFKNRDLSVYGEKCKYQDQQKIASVLHSTCTKIHSTLNVEKEFDSIAQKEFRDIQQSGNTRRTGHLNEVLDSNVVARVEADVRSLSEPLWK